MMSKSHFSHFDPDRARRDACGRPWDRVLEQLARHVDELVDLSSRSSALAVLMSWSTMTEKALRSAAWAILDCMTVPPV